MSAALPTYKAPALEKGLDILELLSSAQVPLSLSDLARGLGRTSSEIFRMLVLLERRGYVLKDSESGRYALSLRLFAMAHTHNPLEHLIRAAQPAMRRLAEATRESCHLAVLHQNGLMVAARVEAPTPIRLSMEVGSVFDAGPTTSARVIATMLSDAERAGRFEDRPPSLRTIARQGWLAEPSLSHAGVHNLSVPIRLPGQPAALTLVWIKERDDAPPRTDTLLSHLLACAAAISAILGLDRLKTGQAA